MSSTATITELGLDLKPPSAMVTVIISLREVSPAIGDGEGRAVKLEEYIRNLEEEKRKVEGFKRELPFTIPVMNDVIEGIKKELKQCMSENNASPCPPVLEEFMPVRSNFEEEGGVKPEKDFKEKMSWMSSVQLWNDDYSSDNNNNNKNNSKKKNTKERDEEENEQTDSENLSGERKYKVGGGAFLPFKGISGSSVPKQHPSSGSTSSKGTAGGGGGGGRVVMPSPENSQSGLHVQEHQGPRKARRCWSPELHRRFVNALQQLGGSQVATPKQIRELMKVDGLTNDEVKSHLQKYRLHTRRPPPASAPANQQLLMLGDLWVNQDHYPVSKQESGSPQGPLQLAGSSRGISVTGGDSCGEEDGKSESYSWKGNLQRSTEEDTD